MLTRCRFARRLAAPILALALVAVLPGSAPAAPPCDADGSDATAVANARATVDVACDCASATGVDRFRGCVRDTLAPLVASGDLSDACRRHVYRVETRSTCGRADRVVCCRTEAGGRTTGTMRRAGRCSAPPGVAACESNVPWIADACTATGCVIAPACGNRRPDPGETCDPPNGTTCSDRCTACAPEAGSILVGCSSVATRVVTAATADRLLVAYTDQNVAGEFRSLARRLANDGSVADVVPLEASGLLPGTSARHGFTSGAASDGTEFYVAWETYADYFQYFGGRRIPASGPISAEPDILAEHLPFGTCRISIAGPLYLAPTLDSTSFHVTSRRVYSCMGQILFETLGGVGDFFAVPPPGVVSSGSAPIVRGPSDVAAAWWGIYADPPSITPFLAASLVEPGAPVLVPLSTGSLPVRPAIAAAGEVFVVLWANGSELRATRFTRASGPLHPDGGFLVASTDGAIGDLAAATVGGHVLAVWRESAAAGSRIRAIRIAADGSVPDPTPIEVATSTAGGAVSVAANAGATLVAFTRAEATGSSVRAVLLDD